MKIFFSILLTLTVCSVTAQNAATSTVSWSSKRTVDTGTGKMAMEETRLIVYKQDSVLWKNTDGGLKERFVVKETTGTWTNIAAKGEITYKVDGHQKRGIIRIKKTETDTSIRLILVSSEGTVTTDLSVSGKNVL